MKIKLLLITLASFLVAACGVEKQILEDILIAEVVGYVMPKAKKSKVRSLSAFLSLGRKQIWVKKYTKRTPMI
ncbi:hypothetical protein Q5O89_03490 [Peribacillus frigoritolerans]|nr:hypothetical protein [Peribacillus frigoritolerans]